MQQQNAVKSNNQKVATKMQKIQRIINNRHKVIFLLILIITIMNGCKKQPFDKNSNQVDSKDQNAALANRNSLLQVVNNHLDSLIQNSSSSRATFITQVRSNIVTNSIKSVTESNRQILVADLNNFSAINLPDSLKTNSKAVLFVYTNENGSITGSELTFFKPLGTASSTISNESFIKMLNGEFEVDGTFRIQDFNQIPLFQITTSGSAPQKVSYQSARMQQNQSPICLNYYWVETTFFTNGTSQTIETLLFSTCDGSGGGGNQPSPMAPEVRNLHYSIYHHVGYNQNWEVFGKVSLVMHIFPNNPAQNEFLDILTSSSAPYLWAQNALHGPEHLPYHTQSSNPTHNGSVSINRKQASVNQSLTVRYPNIPNHRPFYVGRPHTFFASTVARFR